MSLRIVHPSENETLRPDFTAFGLYEHPEDLVAILVRLSLAKPNLLHSCVVIKKPGTWNFAFHLGDGPFGDYILAVIDQKRGAAQYVPIRVRKKRKFDAGQPRISIDYPTSTFHSDDTAYGYAPVRAPTPDPNMTVVFVYNDGTMSPPGTNIDNPTAPDYYWSSQFSGLPTDNNPCDCHATSDQHPQPADNGNIVIIPDDQANDVKKRKKKKKKKKKKK